MFTFLNFALVLGSILRLTRLVVEDSITAPLRARAATVKYLGKLVSCSWCSGFWISLFVVAWSYYDHDHLLAFRLPAYVLTLSWLVGIAQQWLDAPPPDRTVHLVHHNQVPPGGPTHQ
ncbi:hypothetical protein ACFC1T_09555 [Kitasatospora sp. NPDC056076]|uniref:hypothetical protein n=1 Tax=Kitasatospora sp. NPDC056076 TaxID=3345703 RepID=UPI0035E16A69